MAYEKEAQQYQDDVSRYLNHVRSGSRTIRLVDPQAEQFSQAKDDQRQISAIDKANTRANGPELPESVDLSEGDSTPLPDSIDLSEGQSVRSKGIGEVYQSHRPDWNAPPRTAEHPVAKEAARVLNALSPITNMLQEIGAPLETLGDYYRGAISKDTVLPGIGREGSYAGPKTPQELNPSIGEAIQAGDPATGLIRELATGLGTNPAFVGMSPLLRRPQPPMPVTPYQLKELSAHEMLGSVPVEIPRPVTPMQNPEAITMPGQPSGYKVQPTGRFVLPTGAAPDITDLAQAHQAQVLEGSRTGTFYDLNSPAMPVTHAMDRLARTDRLLGTESELPDTIQPFDKPRALRSAEEIIQERQTMESKLLHGRKDQAIREANAYIPYGSSETASEGAALGAQRGLKAATAKERRLQEARELDIEEFAKDYVKEREDLKPSTLSGPVSLPSGPLPRTFDNLSADSMFPSVRQRIVGDVLSVIGKYSPAWKGASDSILKTYEIAAKDASKSIELYKEHVAELFGKRNWFQRKGIGFKELTEGENVAIASAQRAFNLSPEVEEAAFNYLYTNGKMEPPAAIRDQAIKYAELTYQDMLQPTSSHPGVRLIKQRDPFTGELSDPGQPSMFVAHQPIKEMSRDSLKRNQWELLYNRMGGAEKTKLNLEDFIKRVVGFSKRDPEVGVEIFNMPNLQQKRIVDLSALGGSPYQWAKKLGYETDLFSMAVRYRASGTLRGELELLRPGLDALKAATTGLDAEGAKWLSDALDFAMKVPHGADQVKQTMTKSLQAARRWADMTQLKLSLLTNATQFAYPLAKAMGTPILGAKANLKGILDYTFGNNQGLIRQSGALLPSVLNEFSHPTGPLAVWHANIMRLYGMPLIDRNTRLFAGHIANRYITELEQHFLANPTSKVHAQILNDMGGPAAAKTILTEGKVNDELRLEMIQRFANQTSGVLDARGLPWYATSENPYAKAVLQYKPFLIANSAEIHRMIANAPNRLVAANRFTALVAGGGAAGLGAYEAKQLYNSIVQGDMYEKPTKDDAYALEAAIAGMSGAYSAATIDALNDATRNRIALSIPILSYPSGLAKDLMDSVKHGPGWRSVRTLSEIPGAGLVTAPVVKGLAKEEAKALRESQE